MKCTELRITAAGVELAALYHTGAGLPVIALHGWLDNAASFAALAAYMQSPFLIPDLAGHGHSNWRAGVVANNLWDELPEIIGLADHMGWSQFGLLGHSRGAIHALLLAAVLPERVTRVALIEGLCPTTCPPAGAPQQLRKALGQAMGSRASPKVYPSLEAMVMSRRRTDPGLPLFAAQLLVERGARPVAEGFVWRHDPRQQAASPVLLTDDQAEAFLPAVQAPTLLIKAAQGFLVHDPRLEQRQRLCQHLQHVILPGGHHLHMEPAAAADIGHRLNVFFGEQA